MRKRLTNRVLYITAVLVVSFTTMTLSACGNGKQSADVNVQDVTVQSENVTAADESRTTAAETNEATSEPTEEVKESKEESEEISKDAKGPEAEGEKAENEADEAADEEKESDENASQAEESKGQESIESAAGQDDKADADTPIPPNEDEEPAPEDAFFYKDEESGNAEFIVLNNKYMMGPENAKRSRRRSVEPLCFKGDELYYVVNEFTTGVMPAAPIYLSSEIFKIKVDDENARPESYYQIPEDVSVHILSAEFIGDMMVTVSRVFGSSMPGEFPHAKIDFIKDGQINNLLDARFPFESAIPWLIKDADCVLTSTAHFLDQKLDKLITGVIEIAEEGDVLTAEMIEEREIECFPSFQGPIPMKHFYYNAKNLCVSEEGDFSNISYLNFIDKKIYKNGEELKSKLDQAEQIVAMHPGGEKNHLAVTVKISGTGPDDMQQSIQLNNYDDKTGELLSSAPLNRPVYLIIPINNQKWFITTRGADENAPAYALLDVSDPQNPQFSEFNLHANLARIIKKDDDHFILYNPEVEGDGYQKIYYKK